MKIELEKFDSIDFTVPQFIKIVDAEFKTIRGDQDYGKLVRARGTHRKIKKFIEEILPLQKYLLFRLRNGMASETIKWMNSNQRRQSNQKGDAILNSNEIIEITVAEHEKEYIVREHINKGNPTFGADGASKKNGVTNAVPVCKSPQDRINAHTKMLEDAVSKKLYKYNRLSSLVIYLNQDGFLMEDEFNTVIENIEGALSYVDKIDHVFIWSFQYEALMNCKRKSMC